MSWRVTYRDSLRADLDIAGGSGVLQAYMRRPEGPSYAWRLQNSVLPRVGSVVAPHAPASCNVQVVPLYGHLGTSLARRTPGRSARQQQRRVRRHPIGERRRGRTRPLRANGDAANPEHRQHVGCTAIELAALEDLRASKARPTGSRNAL
jgi:hypothetical protein